MLFRLAVLGAIGLLLGVACGAKPGPTAGNGTVTASSVAQAQASNSPSTSVTSSGSCAGPTECADCTKNGGCTFCTGSRTCMTFAEANGPNVACPGGLMLSHRDSCGSDPVVAARVHAREVEARRKSAADATAGMAPLGGPIVARLEQFSTLEIPIPAGSCNTVVYRLAPEAAVGNVLVDTAFVTQRSNYVGRGGFDLESRVSRTRMACSSLPGTVRFRLVDRWSYAPKTNGGTGSVTFETFTRPRKADDPDDARETSPRERGDGAVGVDCLDCTFPCSSGKTACERDCFRSGAEAWQKTVCNSTCDQIYRSCLRGCGAGCN